VRAWQPLRRFFRPGEGVPAARAIVVQLAYAPVRPLRDRQVRLWALPGAGPEHFVRGSCKWRFRSAPAMHLPLGGGGRALFIVAETAVWLGMLICICGPGGTAAAGLVR
jgi:hypothetical protein